MRKLLRPRCNTSANPKGCLYLPELASIHWGKSFDDAAVGHGSMAALPDKEIQFSAQRRQIGQLALHLGKMLTGDCVNSLARPLLLVCAVKQRPNLLNRESEVASAPDEDEAAEMGG